MTQIWWLRHGPTHVNGFVGWSDAPADLSDTAALSRLQQFLPDDALVVSSDLQRATKTADAIAQGRTRLPHNRDLREMNFGAWEMKTFQQVTDMDAQLARQFWEQPGDIAPPNGESWHQTSDRVAAAVDRLISDHPKGKLIIVAHVGVILTQLQRATTMAPTAAMSFVIDNLSVTHMEHLGSAWRVRGVNHKP